MTGFAIRTSARRAFRLSLCACVFSAAAAFAPVAGADPLSPVNDTLEQVTDTVGNTVSGAAGTVGRTTGTLGSTIQDDRPLAPIGRDITQPVGTLNAPAPSSSGPTYSRSPEPEEYRSYDAFQPYTPDTLPRGTLARIYFQPGETALDLGAQNQIAGFANSFGNRVGNVEIRGYADRGRGKDAGASDLAMQRALAVQQALLQQGFSTGRVRASGMGNTDMADAAEDRVDILFDGY